MKTATKREHILDVFSAMSPRPTIEEVTFACMHDGVWSKEEDLRLLLRARKDEVRKQLNAAGIDGLPAGLILEIQTEDERLVSIAVQRKIWSVEDFRLFFPQRVSGIRADAKKLLPLYQLACERWPDENWDPIIAPIRHLMFDEDDPGCAMLQDDTSPEDDT